MGDKMIADRLVGPIRRTAHRGEDDLVSAGLGLAGLAGLPTPFADPSAPTAAELRRRAIQTGWKGIADLGPLGGYGRIYGDVVHVPGREYSAFARLPQARHPHRVLCQVPDTFDAKKRCLLVAPASGSRGIYGAMALAGGLGLAHGCALVYTDKGAGSGYFDSTEGTGVAIDGRRAEAGSTLLEFEPNFVTADAGVAAKHAHSGDHPEADWGAHVLQALAFGLAMLDEAIPALAPFTPENTRIIAVGISNGGAAVLQAAGADHAGWLDGVVAIEPNVYVAGQGRALYDYASEAALWMPVALTSSRFQNIPFARLGGVQQYPAWMARGSNLVAHACLDELDPMAHAETALERLHASGWNDDALTTAASSVAFDLWRAVAVTYASAYLRAQPGAMPCGYAFRSTEVPGIDMQALRAAWWSDGNGIPPDVGISLFGGLEASLDPTLPGVLALRHLWDGADTDCATLHTAVAATSAGLPRAQVPIWIVHGAEDGLIPAAFASDVYIDWLRQHDRSAHYWCVPHAQHFDAFLQVPGFGDRYVPLLPYAYVALEQMLAHVVQGAALPDWPTPQPQPRGAALLERDKLDLPR